MSPLENVSDNWNNRWRKPGDEQHTDVPTLFNYNVASGLKTNRSENFRNGYEYGTYLYDLSDLRVAKSSFLRLRMVGLSYLIPEKILSKVGISSMQLRFQASNLHVWAKKAWKGLDPETPSANIPILPSYSLGINVTF